MIQLGGSFGGITRKMLNIITFSLSVQGLGRLLGALIVGVSLVFLDVFAVMMMIILPIFSPRRILLPVRIVNFLKNEFWNVFAATILFLSRGRLSIDLTLVYSVDGSPSTIIINT